MISLAAVVFCAILSLRLSTHISMNELVGGSFSSETANIGIHYQTHAQTHKCFPLLLIIRN